MSEYDYTKLDAVFHSRIRLAAASLLYHDGSADFNTLKARIGATDGNLTTHMRKMEEAGYLDASKGYEGRKPITVYRLTDEGVAAFEKYINRLEFFLQPKHE